MSDPRDSVINKERIQRIADALVGAGRLESRAHSLIMEAHELRKLAYKLNVISEDNPAP